MRVYAVEDGAVAYTGQTFQHSLYDRLINKLLFGPSATMVAVEGSSNQIAGFYARYPEYVREELRHRPLLDIPVGGLDKFDALSWPLKYLHKLGRRL